MRGVGLFAFRDKRNWHACVSLDRGCKHYFKKLTTGTSIFMIKSSIHFITLLVKADMSLLVICVCLRLSGFTGSVSAKLAALLSSKIDLLGACLERSWFLSNRRINK